MRSQSTTPTEPNHFVALTAQPSFRNQVSSGLWQGSRAYQKVYPESEYWQMELAVLQQFADHPDLNIPLVYYASRSELQTVMSEVPGQKLDMISAVQIEKLAQVLRVFQAERKIQAVGRLDIRERLGLFYQNTCQATCLTIAEEEVAKQTHRLLEQELVAVAESSDDLVHGDFNLGNVLFDQPTAKFGLIDFERAFIGLGLLDVAKGAWRILDNNAESVSVFLHAYYGRIPTSSEQQHFLLAQMYEYLGAISYFALEGHSNGYPYKDQAINQLRLCLSCF